MIEHLLGCRLADVDYREALLMPILHLAGLPGDRITHHHDCLLTHCRPAHADPPEAVLPP